MSDRSSKRGGNPERSALVRLPPLLPKPSAKELGLWKDYLQNLSRPRLYTPLIQPKKKDARHSQLLEDFKNYYIDKQIVITDHDTILYIIRTYCAMTVRSEHQIVDCLHLPDPNVSSLPEAVVALYYLKTPENGKPYLDRALFVRKPFRWDPANAPARGQQLGACFLSVAEDLEEEVSCRFYVAGGQSGGPLYGQYVQDDASGSVAIERLDQGKIMYKSTAVVWRKREPLKRLGREEWERNKRALGHIVAERRLYVKPLRVS